MLDRSKMLRLQIKSYNNIEQKNLNDSFRWTSCHAQIQYLYNNNNR